MRSRFEMCVINLKVIVIDKHINEIVQSETGNFLPILIELVSGVNKILLYNNGSLFLVGV